MFHRSFVHQKRYLVVSSEKRLWEVCVYGRRSRSMKPRRPVPAGTLFCPWQRLSRIPVPADGAMHTCHKVILFYYETLRECVSTYTGVLVLCSPPPPKGVLMSCPWGSQGLGESTELLCQAELYPIHLQPPVSPFNEPVPTEWLRRHLSDKPLAAPGFTLMFPPGYTSPLHLRDRVPVPGWS